MPYQRVTSSTFQSILSSRVTSLSGFTTLETRLSTAHMTANLGAMQEEATAATAAAAAAAASNQPPTTSATTASETRHRARTTKRSKGARRVVNGHPSDREAS